MARTPLLVHPVLPTLSASDLEVIPRVAIAHNEGQFTFNDLPIPDETVDNAILLGLVRQRSYWEFEGSIKRCQSYDFETGYPTAEFPWEASNFDKPAVTEGATLPCGNCRFKDWTPDPSTRSGSRQAPCREQFVIPLLIGTDDGGQWDDANDALYLQYRLGFITFQKSSLKPAMEYLRKNFQAKKKACYTQTTQLRLNTNLGNGYKYSVPTFTPKATVDPRAYRALSAMLAAARATLTTPRPTRAKTGGMLSVSTDAPVAIGYSGKFFL